MYAVMFLQIEYFTQKLKYGVLKILMGNITYYEGLLTFFIHFTSIKVYGAYFKNQV